MANLFLKTAGGAWSAAATWSTTEAAGADSSGPPLASTDVILDLLSGPVTIDAGAVCRSINLNSGVGGYNNTITHTSGVTLTIGDATAGAGNVALDFSGAGGSFVYTLGSIASSNVTFVSTSVTQQAVNFNGKIAANVTFNGVGGSWQLTGTLTCSTSATLGLTAGSLDTNGQTVAGNNFSSSNSNVRSLTLGSSSINLSSSGGPGWSIATTTNLTFNAGTSTITLASGNNQTFFGGGKTYNVVAYTVKGNGQISGANTFATLTINGENSTLNGNLSLTNNQIITGTLTLAGFDGALHRLLITSSILGTPVTLTAATVVASNVDFRDIYGAGAAASANAVGGYFVARKRSIKSQWPYTLNRSSDQAQGLVGWWPGGPSGGPRLFDQSGRGNHGIINGTIPATGIWAAGNGGGKGALTPDGSTNYVAIPNINESVSTLSCFCWFKSSTAALNVTFFGHYQTTTNNRMWALTTDNTAASGVNFRIILSQDGTLTNATILETTTLIVDGKWHHCGFTYNAGAVALYVDGLSRSFSGSIFSSSLFRSTSSLSIGGANPDSGGTSFCNCIIEDCRVYSRTQKTSEVYAIYSPTSRWGLRYQQGARKATNSGTWDLSAITGKSGDCGGNSGITFTTSAAQNATVAGTKNWSDATIWTSRVPLPQDDATATAWSSGTLTADMPRLGRNIDFSGATAGRTLSINSTSNTIYGSLNLTKVTTLTTSGSFNFTFEGRGSYTLTSAGNSFNTTNVVIVAAFQGSLTLQDAYAAGTSSSLSLTAGKIDANGFNVTVGFFNANTPSLNNTPATIAFGSGTWTITGNSGTVFGVGAASANASRTITIIRGNPIVLNYSGSTGTRTINVGGNSGTLTTREEFALDFNVTAGSDTFVQSDGGACRNLDFTGFSGTFNDTNSALFYFGNLTISTGMSINSSNSGTTFRASSGTQVITSNGKTFDFPITVNAPGATVQLADNLTVGSTRTVTLTAGTLDANGKNFTMGSFASGNSNVRAILMGVGTWTITANSNCFANNIVTNLTLTRGNPFVFSYSGSTGTRTISWGSSSGAIETNVPDVSITAGTDAIAVAGGLRSVNLTGFAGTFNLNSGTIFFYGSLTMTATHTMDAGGNTLITFAATSGTEVITSAGQTINQPITFNGVGGTFQLADDMVVGATRTVTLTNGTLNLNNHNLKMGLFSVGSGTKTLTLGNGICELTGTGVVTVWDAATNTTGLTVSATTGTIKISGSSASIRTFAGGGKTYGNIWITNATSGGETDFTGSNTFLDFKQQDATSQTIKFTAGTTTTVSTWSAFGTASNLLTIGSITAAGHTLTSTGGVVSSDYLSISRSTVTPSTTWYAGTHSTDGGNNSGWIFTAPPASICGYIGGGVGFGAFIIGS